MEEIRVNQIEKTYIDGTTETRVLKGIDFSVSKGEFVSIIGSSGAGKSTFLYQIGLLDTPTKGDIFLRGERANDLSVNEKTLYRLNNFGFIFQDYALMPELKAWENIALPMLMRGKKMSDAKRKAVEILEQLEMGDRVNHLPNQLSGGESQRVSIGRAIVHKPSILFADEPTANLDSAKSRQILDILHGLHKEGQTIIMVTHELEYAKEASRMITIVDGRIDSDEKL